MSKTLAVLIAEAKKGENESFREIFEQTHARVFNYVLSHVWKRDDALDLTQEAFIDLWKGLRTFTYRSEEEFYGFVFLIVKRKILRFRQGRRETISLDEEAIDPGFEEQHEDHRFLIRQMETLAVKYQEILRLRYWGGMKLAEAAAVLGINEATAKVWHYRALQQLRLKVTDY
ncbi:MAG: RNA polymerase sigma factor [Candidatus Paceibacterota bacterium]|jgi:RNA polymerase sigma-70 factor (ECF subfamily)